MLIDAPEVIAREQLVESGLDAVAAASQRVEPATFTAVRYPLGYQDFRSLREDGCVYVDKTSHIARVANAAKYFFLSRPRRFGKSLTCSTLNELYSGDRELFRGLWAYDNWDFEAKRSSVIWLKFASSGYGSSGLDFALHAMLDRNAEQLGVEIGAAAAFQPDVRLEQLIRAAATASPSGKTVLLVDEYDKPIIDYLNRDDDMRRATDHREQLRWFYSVLKDADPLLELVFITGVTAFSKVSLFSEVNNLVNLSLDPLAHTLVGITQKELDAQFADELAATGEDPEEVRSWYNGYAFGRNAERVYNPWSLLTFLRSGELESHWYETGTPYWLTRYMAQEGIYDVEGQMRTKPELLSFDLSRLEPISILYQTGYLTVVGYDNGFKAYKLGFPNREVRAAFEISLLESYTKTSSKTALNKVASLVQSLRTGRLEDVIDTVNAALADVPYQLWDKHLERTYHAITHVLFWALGSFITSEVSSGRGRADAIVQTEDRVYCFEFKVGATVADAIAQIRERGYLAPYAADGRECLAVGISFDAGSRQVGDWAAEVVA